MTAMNHPLLRHAPPPVRKAAAERLGIAPPPAPDPPVPVDASDVIARLRSGRGKDPRYVLDGVAVADWDLIVREHRRAPLPDAIGAGLVARDDCPPWAALRLVVAHSTSRRGLATVTLTHALASGAVTPRQVLYDAKPGWSAMRVLEKYATRHDGWLAPIRRVLDDAAALLPGDDLDAWTWLLTHGPHHRGTYPELCALAGRADRPPPDSGARPPHWDFANPVGPLSRTSGKTAARVIAGLPPSTISAFTETPRLPASVVIPALRRVPDLTGALVRQIDTTPAHFAALLRLNDSQVNSALIRHHDDPETADAVFRTARRDAPRTVPLTPATRRELMLGHLPPSRLAGAVHGHYPQLIRTAFTTLRRTLGTARCLHGLLGLWETQGPAGVRHPDTAEGLDDAVEAVRRDALGAHDSGRDGAAVLREALARHEAPEALIEEIRREPDLAAPSYPPGFWPAAVAAHTRDPLPRHALLRLARAPHCPAPIGLSACRAGHPHELGGRSRAYALTALTHHPLPPPEYIGYGTANSWCLEALTRGLVDIREVVELGHSARHLFDLLDTVRAVLPDQHARAEAHITVLTARTLRTDPEAWTVAAHLLPDFVGTLPELLTTVAAVTA
ncbi:hypothetical protein LO772_18695 [Yinghuangia sp. ASG 101]|uniref:hypothetical protein n=1 Tax=Yinghuangia sp. ASG 101 TaxID=2896848 RepID=UPI001E35F650|nr:hypothetical protein [Yinghuangia sp. ASG 101]UGQ09003.1 hypothetical protein LO772_18695 [Yinghuangia sp. ASG 101]